VTRLEPEHILLDLDGTLLESSSGRLRVEFIARAVMYLHKRGIPAWKTLLALHRMRLAVEKPGVQFTNEQRASQAFSRVLGISESEAHGLLRSMVSEVFSALRGHFSEIPQAREFVKWALPHYPLSLATNPFWPREIVELRLGWAGIPISSFQTITHAELMRSAKPRVEFYKELLDKLAVAPERCLMIGDSERKDLPASRAGIPVFLVEPRSPSEELIQVRDHVWSGGFAALKRLLGPKARAETQREGAIAQ
jgi:FMN phosphatase YigB (HAD superfamily)